jgi:hypothetical protein
MDIKINLVELATELAAAEVFEEFCSYGPASIYQETEEGTEYTADAQRSFDNWYDYFYDMINKYKID